MTLLLFLLGYVRFFVGEESVLLLLNVCQRQGITLRRVKEREGGLVCEVTRREYATLRRAGAVDTAHVLKVGGVGAVIAYLSRRTGLLCGIAAGLCLFTLSFFFVWDVDVVGNTTLEAGEILEELSAAGLCVGGFLPSLDTDAVENALRLGDSRISYAAVNVTGTVVTVQIREAEEAPKKSPLSPANLVAKRDGVVTQPLVFEGECLVSEGSVVRAGQILASGIQDTVDNGVRLTRASGQVMAKTTYTYQIFVPFEYEESIPAGRTGAEISLFFFGRVQKIFKSTGNTMKECDIINKIIRPSVTAGRELPFGIYVTRYTPKEKTPARRTAVEALALAKAELKETLQREGQGRTLLSRLTETSVGEEGVTLTCTVVCEEDIALVVEIPQLP